MPERAGFADAGAGGDRYTAADGVVHDNKTKLTWQQALPKEPLAWADARDYCSSLDLNGTGWRLPSVGELQTIVDESRSNPAIDPKAFPGTPPEYFWTSSILPRFSSYVWTVYFGYGLSTFFDVNQTRWVRCVR